jgi:hypothetical protein
VNVVIFRLDMMTRKKKMSNKEEQAVRELLYFINSPERPSWEAIDKKRKELTAKYGSEVHDILVERIEDYFEDYQTLEND